MDSRYYTYNEATRGYESFVPPPPEGDPPEPAPGYSMQFVSLPLTHDQQAKADKVREGGLVRSPCPPLDHQSPSTHTPILSVNPHNSP